MGDGGYDNVSSCVMEVDGCEKDELWVEEDRQSGSCTWFNPVKGYGFITPNDGSKQLYVHSTAIQGPSRNARSLRTGEPVEFVISIDPATQKWRAECVTGPGGTAAQGAERVQPERRIDPTDGNLYTKTEFLEEYGDFTAWEAAAPELPPGMQL